MESVFSIKGEFSMDNKKYLKWYNKIGYGSGDIAGNVVYAFLATFVMIYLTDTAGLNAGIVGTLMMVSKIFDGYSVEEIAEIFHMTKSSVYSYLASSAVTWGSERPKSRCVRRSKRCRTPSRSPCSCRRPCSCSSISRRSANASRDSPSRWRR